MSSLLNLLNHPRKRKDHYFEFIALSGKHEAFDLDKAKPCPSNPELGRCEWMFHINGDRWVLSYVPFPGDIPPWVDPNSPSDEMEAWERPLPPNRELDREDAARWFQFVNEYELPEKLEPVAQGFERERRDEPTRLDHAWRPLTHSLNGKIEGDPGASSATPAAPPTATARVSQPDQSSTSTPPEHQAHSTIRKVTTRSGDLEDRALVLLMRHPDWSNVRLADELGCHPKSLSRFRRLRDARAINKATKNEFPTPDDF